MHNWQVITLGLFSLACSGGVTVFAQETLDIRGELQVDVEDD